MMTINIKSVHKCAFCKYWYDPTNSAITPRNARLNLWRFDENAKCMCMKKNFEMKAIATCPHYECKLELVKWRE
ncbi:MAG: hypothetical protein HUJ58_07535 [Erysipelotrichaceae bacterium]|nr:hypothetical protein [Erysipelotrichaceae bacterium]